ncbi:MAG: phosphatase PAP2 family protein [Candidatus Marinimicrobia bacterium]|nr:phosphatase PAP2 family protein [Candidatus Neomarinimicrobiota bacterium]
MELILFLQHFDFDWLLMTMKAITFLGNEEFYLLILPILVWCWRKRDVLPLAIILLLSFWLNYEFKEFFQLPRPAGTGLIVAEHYGFPSGHAQGAIVLWGYLAWALGNSNRKAVYGWFALLIFFIGLSRIYLGVHFPGDVIGGWTIGFVFLFTGLWITNYMRRSKFHFPTIPTAILALFSGLMLAIMMPSEISVRVGGMIAGLVGGMILESAYIHSRISTLWWKQVLKIVIGVAGILLIKGGVKIILPLQLWSDWTRYGLIGLWIGLGAPWLFTKVRLAKN